jgi:hypothetical protein
MEGQENQEPKIVVRAIEPKQESKVELEKRLIAEQEEQRRLADEQAAAAAEAQRQEEEKQKEVIPEAKELTEDDVLSFIKTKKGKEIQTLDELFIERVAEQEEIPYEDVKSFLKYKKETGRGIDDFVKLNRDLDKVPDNELLADFYRQSEEMDDDEIAYKLKKFSYDEELDEEDAITEKKLALKRELKKAKKHFDQQKEQYNTPLESREAFIPEDEKEAYSAFKASSVGQQKAQEEAAARSRVFAEKTNALLSDGFEGFEFSIDENTKLKYKPSDPKVMKEQHDISKFISKFLDEDGLLKGDGSEFHKAIAMASDPDKAAKYFIEQGKAMMLSELEKEGKNVDFRNIPEKSGNGGVQVRAVNPSSSDTFKFRKQG